MLVELTTNHLSSGFFAMLCSFFLPPNLPVQLFCFMMLTLVVGLCFSWGIGVAAMRAANAVRSTAHIQAVALQIQQRYHAPLLVSRLCSLFTIIYV